MPDYDKEALYCGTSGFSYASWKPDFYPASLSPAKFLGYYATRLNTVEVNYTYRRLASAATLEKWIASTPPHFLFLPKAHMKITHTTRLADPEDFTRVFLQSLEPLASAERLGPILFQLPPSFKADADRLGAYLRSLPRGLKVTFEFRHPSWFDEKIYSVLRDANAALCLAENETIETPYVLTADFVYLRLRKPEYLAVEMSSILYRVGQYRANAYPTFAIFKHEETPAGALNAERLLTATRAQYA